MDRLVCGDVGFGKTEVALRAAFVMAMTGRQVALICPTTLLARQHHNNFAERFKGFPIEIGRLSRLVPAAEAKSTKEGLEKGKKEAKKGVEGGKSQAQKTIEKAEKEAKEGVEKGKAEANRAIEEAEKRAESYGN